MVGQTVAAALANLRSERARLDEAISALEGLVGGGGGVARRRGRPPGSGKRRGRPPKLGGGRPAAGRKRKNAPRGMLRAKIHEALKKAGKALKPVDLRNAVMRLGYPNKNPKTLYTAVFTAAKQDPAIKKTGDGFSMK
jgi:hypothetical protein